MRKNSDKKPTKEEMEYFLTKMTNKELSLFLEVNLRTVLRWKKEYKIEKYSGKISNKQNDILVATLLSRGKLTISSNEEYMNWAEKELNPITIKLKKNLNIYYKNDINFVVNYFVMANWIAQSGVDKIRKIVLPVKFFDINTVYSFTKKFSTIKNNKIIIEKENIPEEIKAHFIWKSLDYKIICPEKQYFNKLNIHKAREIRSLFYDNNVSAIDLANQYKVSKSTIYNVLNNSSYQERNVANISVIYNL